MGRKKLESNRGLCTNGCNKKIHCRGLCRNCYRQIHYEEHERERRGAVKHDKHPLFTIIIDASGYARIKIDEGHGAKDWIKHHRYIMENLLGRKLFSFESVHHKNGIKHDNRPTNLELWITKQPKGQRPKDLIRFSKWILKTYNNEQN